MYSDGTSALKKEYYTYDNARKLHKEIKIADKKSVKAKKSRMVVKKRIVASIVLLFSMAFLVLFRYQRNLFSVFFYFLIMHLFQFRLSFLCQKIFFHVFFLCL